MLASCGDDAAGGDPEPASGGHAHKGANGGALIDVGKGTAHVEIVHDEAAGTVTLHMTGSDAKTPLKTTFAPDLNLLTAKGPKVLHTKPVDGKADGASKFVVTDPVLKVHLLEGRIDIKLAGKTYSPEIVDAHDDH